MERQFRRPHTVFLKECRHSILTREPENNQNQRTCLEQESDMGEHPST